MARRPAAMQFTGRIELNPPNPYVLVDAALASRLRRNWKGPMPVRIQVNGQPAEPWRINMMPRGDGSFYLYLAGEVRRASGTQVGDTVTVHIAFDDTYRPGPAHAMPAALRARLDDDPAARRAWDALAPSRQKEVLRYLDRLKSEAALLRNVNRLMASLTEAPAPFLGRSWSEGA